MQKLIILEFSNGFLSEDFKNKVFNPRNFLFFNPLKYRKIDISTTYNFKANKNFPSAVRNFIPFNFKRFQIKLPKKKHFDTNDQVFAPGFTISSPIPKLH